MPKKVRANIKASSMIFKAKQCTEWLERKINTAPKSFTLIRVFILRLPFESSLFLSRGVKPTLGLKSAEFIMIHKTIYIYIYVYIYIITIYILYIYIYIHTYINFQKYLADKSFVKTEFRSTRRPHR